MRMIIPCAGFGTRMSMNPNQSKELLLYQGKPLIENALQLAQIFNIKPLVITRIEKQDLIQYCAENDIETQIIDVRGEWADTILQSKPWWEEDNILVLPDTVFDPAHDTIYDILEGLELGNNAVIALHDVKDVSQWGYVTNYTITEKPQFITRGIVSGNAWGVIGFKKTYGEELFSAMTKRNNALQLKNVGFTYLEGFRDLTRTGKIE